MREVTTPSLPGYINLCLNLGKRLSNQSTASGGSILRAVYLSFNELLPLHATLFRPFTAQIRALILPLLAPCSSNEHALDQKISLQWQCVVIARQLYVLQHMCNPKNVAADLRRQSLSSLLDSIRATADVVFRTIREEATLWSRERTILKHTKSGEILCDPCPELLHLPAWEGIEAGLERLHGLLELLSAFMSIHSDLPVVIPVGRIQDAVRRIVFLRSSIGDWNKHLSTEADQNDRDCVTAYLPQLCVSALKCLLQLVSRLSIDNSPSVDAILETVLWTLSDEATSNSSRVRQMCYNIVDRMLQSFGPYLSSKHASLFSTCMNLCYQDVLSDKADSEAPGITDFRDNSMGSIFNLETKANKTVSVQESAAKLLAAILNQISLGLPSKSLRQQLDRAAILSHHGALMLASVRNPPHDDNRESVSTSILPILARMFPGSPEIRDFVRPQMPLVFQHEGWDSAPFEGEHKEEPLEDLRRPRYTNHRSKNGDGTEVLMDNSIQVIGNSLSSHEYLAEESNGAPSIHESKRQKISHSDFAPRPVSDAQQEMIPHLEDRHPMIEQPPPLDSGEVLKTHHFRDSEHAAKRPSNLTALDHNSLQRSGSKSPQSMIENVRKTAPNQELPKEEKDDQSESESDSELPVLEMSSGLDSGEEDITDS